MFLSLALAAFVCLSAAADQSVMGVFISTHFEPDTPAQATALLADGNFYLVSSSGKEIYVVNASSGKSVSDLSLISDILGQDTRSREEYEEKISSAIEFPGLVNDAKMLSEGKCLQYIGDDSDPGCYDRQSCLVSCFSVPQCEIIVQSDGFLEAAMDWDFRRKEYASLVEAYSDGIEAVRFDPHTIDRKLSILSNMSLLAQNMSQNEIFLDKEEAGCTGRNITRRCYEYCPKIDYSQPLISYQAQSLASLKNALAKLGQQQSRAQAILNSSLENDAYVSSRGKDYEEFRLRMKNEINTLKAENAVLAQTVYDPQINISIMQLEGIFNESKNYSESGYYRKALALRSQFEPLSNATSALVDFDNGQYIALALEMENFSSKAKSSAWLIGNQSSAAHLSKLAALKANYTAPLTLSGLSAANATLSALSSSLAAEIASKAVQAGNASGSAQPSLPSAPQPATVIPDFAWAGALMLAAALIYAMMLRFARREPPRVPIPPPLTQ